MRALDPKPVPIDPFIVMNRNEAGVDLVLIQSFLLSYVNHAVRSYANLYFSCITSIRKQRRFVSKHGTCIELITTLFLKSGSHQKNKLRSNFRSPCNLLGHFLKNKA